MSIRIEHELDSGKTTSTRNKDISYSILQDDHDLVKVPCRSNLRVLLPQLNGQFRITFQADPPAIFRQVQQSKHLSGHFKDQCRVIKRESFGDSRFADAIIADLFDVQATGFDPAI